MRELTAFDHLALTREIRATRFQKMSPLEGGYKLRLQGAVVLVLFPDKFYATGYSVQGLQPDRISLRARKLLGGSPITSIRTINLDRVVALETSAGSLVFELFRKGNVVLLDSEGRIVDVLRQGQWSHRELRPGVMYKTPPPPPIAQGSLLAESYVERDLVRSGVPKPYAKEIITRLGLEPREKTKEHEDAIKEALGKLLKELESPAGWLCEGEPFPIRMSYLDCERRFTSFSEAIDSFTPSFFQKRTENRKREYMMRALREIEEEIAVLERAINDLYEHWALFEEMFKEGTFRDVGRWKFKGKKEGRVYFDFIP